jgi:integrase/recombinase XerC
MSASARAASVSAYLDELAGQRRLSPHTVSNYRHDLETLCALIGELPSAIRLRCHRDAPHPPLRRQLHTRGLGGRSLGRTLSAWRGFYRWLVQRGMTPLNPVDSVRPPKSPKALPKALSPDEANRLLAAQSENLLEIRDQAMFELFYSSGLRLAELAALDISAASKTCSPVRCASSASATSCASSRSAARPGRRWRCGPSSAPPRGGTDEAALFVGQRGQRLGVRMIQLRLLRRGRCRACRRACIRTCCAIRLPRTSCSPRATCAPCRRCSATPASPRRRSTPTSISSIWRRSTIRPTRARSASRSRPVARRLVLGNQARDHMALCCGNTSARQEQFSFRAAVRRSAWQIHNPGVF